MTLWLGRIALSLLTFFVVLNIVWFSFVAEFPHVLEGTDLLDTAAPRTPNRFRNFLELAYFFSNVFLLPVAIGAAVIGRNQLLATTRALRADAYLQFSDKILEKTFVNEADIIGRLAAEYQRWNAAFPGTRVEFLEGRLPRLVAEHPDAAAGVQRFLGFLENTGVLVRRQYLNLDDVFYLLEGHIRLVDFVFADYLETFSDGEPGAWEHLIWLIAKTRGYKPRSPLLT